VRVEQAEAVPARPAVKSAAAVRDKKTGKIIKPPVAAEPAVEAVPARRFFVIEGRCRSCGNVYFSTGAALLKKYCNKQGKNVIAFCEEHGVKLTEKEVKNAGIKAA